ncbi:putative membrane protein mmpS3 [Mycobacterium xenopi 3993]|nr:putative membrane protein mmpS3 [Mycobacterium xenopi 3993]
MGRIPLDRNLTNWTPPRAQRGTRRRQRARRRGRGQEDDSEQTSATEFYSQAYSAPESEHFTSGPYVPVDLGLYDYDSYDEPAAQDQGRPPRWPWVVGVAAIVAAIALVVSVSLLFARTGTTKLATPSTAPTSTPPMQDEIIATTPPPHCRPAAAQGNGDGDDHRAAAAPPPAAGG